MKILLVNKFWYIRGGAERVVFATKKLLETVGHEVKIFGMEHPDNILTNNYFVSHLDYATQNPIKKIQAGLKALHNKEAENNFARLLDDFKPDVIHFHNIYHQLSFSILEPAKKRGIPMVMTLHDYKLISPNYNLFHHGQIAEECTSGKYYKCLLTNCQENYLSSFLFTLEAYKFKNKKYQDFVNLYISPSQFLKDKFVSAGFTPDKIKVLKNPLEDLPNKTKPKAGDYVLYFGRLSKEKGVDLLLTVATKTVDIKYKIVGMGPLYNSLIQESSPNVEFLGYKKGEELQAIIANARLVIVPSVWYENAPLSILEAIQMGKVVLASNIGGIPEILPNNLLFPSGNTKEIIKILDYWYKEDDEKIEEIGGQLSQSVDQKNNPKIYLKELLEVYGEAQK